MAVFVLAEVSIVKMAFYSRKGCEATAGLSNALQL